MNEIIKDLLKIMWRLESWNRSASADSEKELFTKAFFIIKKCIEDIDEL